MTKSSYQNNIAKVCEEKDISYRTLAKRVGLSPAQMGRIVSGETKLTIDMALEIADALDCDVSEIIGLPLAERMKDGCDEVLLGSVINWLMEYSAKEKVDLKPVQLTKLAGFLYNEAVKRPLNMKETGRAAQLVISLLKAGLL